MTDKIEPHILRKFEIIQKIGKGAYGIVWKAVDKKYKQVVALKKVFEVLIIPMGISVLRITPSFELPRVADHKLAFETTDTETPILVDSGSKLLSNI